MSALQHTPGRICHACEGFCLQPPVPSVDAGVDIALRIGQRVRHRDHQGQRVTGVVRGLSIDSDRTLQVDIVLDAPIVIPKLSTNDREIEIWHQHVPAHELSPFDDRDELIAELLHALLAEQEWRRREVDGALDPEWDYEVMVASKRRAAIGSATRHQERS